MTWPAVGKRLRNFLLLSDAAAGDTAVSSDLVETYDVLQTVSADVVETYDVMQVVAADLVETYDVLGPETAVSADLVETYDVLQTVSADLVETYDVLQTVSTDMGDTYLIGGGVDPTVTEIAQRLEAEALVEFFEIDISALTGTDTANDHFYFHPGTNELNLSVVWQGITYSPFPVRAEGFEKNTKGTLPRPTLIASNVTSILTAAMLDLDDLVGAKVIRRRTFVRYLDAVNFSAGNALADPDQHLPDDVFFIERKVSANRKSVEWELASALDLEGVKLPSRLIAANYCTWAYRGSECGYTGILFFDVLDRSVTLEADDVCSKSVTGCKLRFGARAALPFGGFPGARTYRY